METDIKELLITPEMLLSQIQSVFNGYYPYLKIEFFQQGTLYNSKYKVTVDPHTPLRQFKIQTENHTIDLNYNRTIAEIIRDFERITGAEIRICRKCGNVWNTVSITDGWTLKSQNAAGELITTVMFNDAGL